MYITERAVFAMKEDGVHLIEVAPGVDLQKDILDQMDFTPIMKDVKEMPAFLFDKMLFQERLSFSFVKRRGIWEQYFFCAEFHDFHKKTI